MKDMNDRVEEAVSDSHRWFPDIPHNKDWLPMWLLCLGGETGELQNKAKKWLRGTYTWEEIQPKLADELVDVAVYVFNVAAALGIDLEMEYDVKRRYNEARFGPGAGAHRAAKGVAGGGGPSVRPDVPAATQHGPGTVRRLHIPQHADDRDGNGGSN